ncbi:radical SAM protein [Microvirga massiliensis]|uniref:radical SAM protein n=1 Tax=Microvirga massiliensis TaxID=1033741 RepID=UPI00062B3753|nr:radical SAM protein [Microvirga massiliensis]
MGVVRLTQIDGKLPNLALMRLSAFHRARGDEIRFTRSVYRHLDEPSYDAVYGSAIFQFSSDRVERLRAEFPDAIIGGTGTRSAFTVEQLPGFAESGFDYSLYPGFEASIGFSQRGCRLSCKFCVVPWKEGKPRAEATIAQIWRGEPHPKHIHLLDNDFFGAPGWQDRIEEIRAGGYKVCFNQGINVRKIDEEVAAALARIEYRDDQFRRRRLYCAWDNLKDEETFFRGVDILEAHGIPPRHLMAFMLIGFAKGETWERIHYRFRRMTERGILPYPMVFDIRATDPERYRRLKAFQRWVNTGLYRAGIPFEEYDVNRRRGDGPDERQGNLFRFNY